MIESFNALINNNLTECQDSHAYPVMRWMSGALENLDICYNVNKIFFKIKPKMVFSLLSLCPTKSVFIKYPKKIKTEISKKDELIKNTIKKIYNWSEWEYQKNQRIIKIDDVLINHLNSIIGFDKSECKILGIQFNQVKKYEYKKTKTLFEF